MVVKTTQPGIGRLRRRLTIIADEKVTIAVTTGTATLKKVGRYDAPSELVLMETGKDGSKLLDSSMTLTFTDLLAEWNLQSP